MAFNWEAFGERLGTQCKSYVNSVVEPLLERLKALEGRAPEKGEKGEPGQNGKDGRDGIDGKDGADGKNGIDGKDAPAVTKAELVEAILPTAEGAFSPLKSVVSEYFKAFPAPAGRDGRDGAPGRDGKDGQKGADGLHGKDGANGSDGQNGKDGLGFDDIQVEYDGDRRFKFVFVRGDQRKEFGAFNVPAMIYRGVWREGEYKKGDVVTWAGSMFVAGEDTNTKPETKDCGWKLSVKRGKDGLNGKDGKPGERGPEGPRGRDLTQMTMDGAKF